jgi:hypothetical protein
MLELIIRHSGATIASRNHPQAAGANLDFGCRFGTRFSRFFCSPLGGNSAWRPRSRIPSREESVNETEKEYERHEHSRGNH